MILKLLQYCTDQDSWASQQCLENCEEVHKKDFFKLMVSLLDFRVWDAAIAANKEACACKIL